MPVRFFVSKTGQDTDLDEFVFEQACISIGRAEENDICLPDPQRVVSKQHAEVHVREGVLELVDRGSKNLTYLRGKPLSPNQPHVLQSGDSFRVGDFELRVERVERAERPAPRQVPAEDWDRTIFEPSYHNPFEEPAERLVGLLGNLQRLYEGEVPSRRQDALVDAINQAFASQGLAREGGSESHTILLDALAARLGLQPAARSPAPPPAPPPPAPASLPPAPAPPRPAPAPPSHLPLMEGTRLDRLLDTLLEAVIRLVGMPRHFRHEFIGQTLVQVAETAFLYEGSPEDLKAAFLDPALSEKEVTDRLERLREAADEVVRHQVALLQGYRASTKEGARRMLDLLDPDRVEGDVQPEGLQERLVPGLVHRRVLEMLKQRAEELRQEDWAAAERRVFRPDFIKAYLASLSSYQRPPVDDESPGAGRLR